MQALPTPEPDSLEHSQRCADHLRGLIGGGSISFAAFMDACLYAPGLGYYTAGSRKFGPAGDFVTAPEISPVFARVIGRQAAQSLAALGGGDVLEFGAGSGKLAVELFRKLEALGAAPARYRILEISPELEQRQRELVAAELPQFRHRFEWLAGLPDAFSGVVIANELLDALPVERFAMQDSQVLQQRVRAGDDGFYLTYEAAPLPLEQAVRRIEADRDQAFPEHYRSEVCLAAVNWTRSLLERIQSGVVFLFDYGTDRSSYYAPDRGDGWLRCHFRHHAHSDPLVYPGIQDITSWVDFSGVAEAAVESGASIGGYVTQAHFLMAGGLDEEMQLMQDAQLAGQVELASRVKTLVLPGEMGEYVKCLGLIKGQLETPAALTSMDMAHRL